MPRDTYTWERYSSATPGYRNDDGVSLRWWAVLAVVLSVALHGGLFYLFNVMEVHLPLARTDQPPPSIRERLTISQELLQQQAAVVEIPQMDDVGRPDVEAFTPDLDRYDVQDLVPEDEAMRFTPDVSEPANLIRESFSETPGAVQFSDSLEALSAEISGLDVGESLQQLKNEVLLQPAMSDQQLRLDAGTLDVSDPGPERDLLQEATQVAGGGDDDRMAGFSSLDQLLGQGGQLAAGTDPILMPTDLLFGYDSAELMEGARLSLMKLGMLIMRNPDSVFVIEGHTDTFGPDEYNIELSRRRAQAVKTWLVQSLRIDPGRIETVGYGKSRPLVNPDGTPEQQQLNRRVEIEVKPR